MTNIARLGVTYAFGLLTVTLSPSVSRADLMYSHACNGVLGPEASSGVSEDSSKNGAVRESAPQCAQPDHGFAFDLRSFDPNIWNTENHSIALLDVGANNGGCGPNPSCFWVTWGHLENEIVKWGRVDADSVCYKTAVNPPKQQAMHAFVTPCMIERPTTYNLAVAVRGNGKGAISALPDQGGKISNCTTACADRFDGDIHAILTAAPTGNSTFAGWSGDPECDGRKDNSIEILPTRILIHCYARFD